MRIEDINATITLSDDIVVANKDDYFMGNPKYVEVKDIVKDSNKLVILI